MKKDFNIKEFISSVKITVPEKEENKNTNFLKFSEITNLVEKELDSIDSAELNENNTLSRQRQALLGDQNAIEYYKVKIKEIINKKDLRKEKFPSWYKSLEDALYHEILGFYGISEWLNEDKYTDSDACMVISDNIFFEIDGEPRLQRQTISRRKRDRLKETLLLTNPKEPRDSATHELYSGGRRVTVFNDNGVTKEGQDCIIFRKYHVNVYTFEQQAEKGTIPFEAIPLFKAMVKLGYTVAFTGPPKSAKSTFLTTYQSYENPKLVGLSIETDPEIPLHILMPEAPIIQFVPDEKNMDTVIERAKRSDAKYIIVGEARNGKMMNVAVEAANMGTMRTKVSYHTRKVVDFPYDCAEKMARECGGNILSYMIKVAETFQYIFNFYYLPEDPSQKRLKGMWEVRYDSQKMRITFHQICKYIQVKDSWVWKDDFGEDKEEIAQEQSPSACKEFKEILKVLAEKYPNMEENVFQDPYLKILLNGGGSL